MRKPFITNVAFPEYSATIQGITYYIRNGKTHARKTTQPSNPNTPRQRLVREAFTTAIAVWKTLDEAIRAPWIMEAGKRKISGYNLFIGKNVPLLKSGRPMIISLEYGMQPPASISAEGAASGEISCTVTRPEGDSSSHVTVFAVPVDRAENEAASHKAHILPENSSVTITGLVPGVQYFVYALTSDREYSEALSVSRSVNTETPVTAGA